MIFFDHAAAEVIPQEVTDYYFDRLRDSGFVNQESVHAAGRQAAKRLEQAGNRLSALFGRGRNTICWAATGSDLFRILAATFGNNAVSGKPTAALTSRLEHPAAEANLKYYFNQVIFLENDRSGRFCGELPPLPCRLALLGAVNSELGIIQNLSPFYREMKQQDTSGKSVFAVDFIQGAGKLQNVPDGDILLVSGHKFGAPGGAAMICRDRATAEKLEGYRKNLYGAGRVEVPLMESMVFALERRLETAGKNWDRVSVLNAFIRDELKEQVEFTLPLEDSSPYLLHFSVPGYQSGVLLRLLSAAGVMCSAGSACQAETGTPSRVLKALKWSDKKAYSALRLSFCPSNTLEEAREFVSVFRQVLRDY